MALVNQKTILNQHDIYSTKLQLILLNVFQK